MKASSYEQWKSAEFAWKLDSKIKKERLVKCPCCKGLGGKDCDCNCDHCEVFIDCESCDGLGKVDICEITEKEYSPEKIEYFNSILSSFKMLADWQNKQLFEVMGSFVKDFRNEHEGII